MRFRHLAALLILAFTGLRGLAQEADKPVEIVLPVVKFNMVDGEPFTISIDDGREARLKKSVVDSAWLTSTFKVVDNTCTARQGMTCRYKFRARSVYMAFIWSKHSDAKKIGQIVQIGNVSYPITAPLVIKNPRPMELDFLFAGLAGSHNAKLNQPALGDHIIECDDFSWLPTETKAAPEKLHMARWDGEDNRPNDDTDANENRTVSGAYGVDFIRISPQAIKIVGVSGIAGDFEFFDALTLNPNMSLSLTKPGGEICQVGLNSNLINEVGPAIEQLSEKIKDAPKTDYITGSDESVDRGASDFQYWMFQLEGSDSYRYGAVE